jgi:hypothetical protein
MNMEKELNEQAAERRALRRLIAYVFGLVVISSFLLAVNTGMIFGLTQAIRTLIPEWAGNSQVFQFINYICPMILLYLEWYAWDVISARQMHSRN